jgi:hypothetical protein
MAYILKAAFIAYKRVFIVFVVLLGFCSQANSQVRFDYISDWSDIVLSNINIISRLTDPQISNILEKRSQNFTFVSSLSFNDFYREKRGSINRDLYYFNQVNTLRIPINFSGHPFMFGAQFRISQKEISYDLTREESFRMLNTSKGYLFSMETPLWKNYLQIKAGLGKKNTGSKYYHPWNVGISFKPVQSILLSYHRYQDFFQWEYDFYLEDPPIVLIATEYSYLDEYKLAFRLLPQLTFTAYMQNNYINKNRNIDNSGTTLLPIGTQYQRYISLDFNPVQNLCLEFQYYNRKNNLSGRFYDNYQTFGKLNTQKDEAETFRPEITYHWNHHSIGMNLEWGKGKISQSGHVESWPFTPTWMDLLGIRQNFKSKLVYDLLRIGSNYRYMQSRWHFSIDAVFERMHPIGEARTWQPDVLVFGVENLNVYPLLSDKRDGVYLGLRLGRLFGDIFQISYEFHQYVPLNFSQNKQSQKIYDSTDIKKYGGGKHYLQVAFIF